MTSKDTVERAARAIYQATVEHYEFERPYWNDLCSEDKRLCFEQARAAISARPSPDVGEAARVLLGTDELGGRPDVYKACENRVKVYKFDAVLRALSTPPKEDKTDDS